MRLSRIVLLALLASGGCSPAPPDVAAVERELLEADRAFAQAATEDGLDGWISWFAADAARIELPGSIIRGLDDIREFDGALFEDPAARLEWRPTDAGSFGEDLGFTRGSYQVVRREAGSARVVVATGTYLTVWRRENGAWKVLLDTGVPDVE